jgi:beta-barrel assembly-enhancing protease
MKKTALLFFMLSLLINLFAQYPLSLEGTVNKTIYLTEPRNEMLAKDNHVTITGIYLREGLMNYLVSSNDKTYSMPSEAINNIDFIIPAKTKDAWDMILLGTPAIQNLATKNFQYGFRDELNQEVYEYMKYCRENNLLYHDSYLEDYIQGLLSSVHSINIADGRPGTLNICLIKDSEPEAFCAPNGTVFITTGMLSLIQSEDELVAVLTHEVAHFVLDHPVIQLNVAAQRQRRAEFWSGFATVMAATAEAVAFSKNQNFEPGSFTDLAYLLSSAIAADVLDRMGLNYSLQQLREADRVTEIISESLGRKPGAYSVVLQRIKNYYQGIGDYSGLSGKMEYQAIDKRISETGAANPLDFDEKSYTLRVSMAITTCASIEYSRNHLVTSSELLGRSIAIGSATEDDYLLRAMIITKTLNSKEGNESALAYLQQAKSLNICPRNVIYKQEGITLMRLKRYAEAKVAFAAYLSRLNEVKDPEDSIINEIDWTRKMIFKLDRLVKGA